MSASPPAMISFAWLGSVIMPTAAVGNSGLFTNSRSERHLEPGPDWNLRVRNLPARRNVDQVNAMLAQRAAPARRTHPVDHPPSAQSVAEIRTSSGK